MFTRRDGGERKRGFGDIETSSRNHPQNNRFQSNLGEGEQFLLGISLKIIFHNFFTDSYIKLDFLLTCFLKELAF